MQLKIHFIPLSTAFEMSGENKFCETMAPSSCRN